MQSLVRHLHAFAREVRLTEAEWQQGIEFLTRAGHITDDRRQEFILLSDVLGLSMMTVAINAPASAGATEFNRGRPVLRDGLTRGAAGRRYHRGGQGASLLRVRLGPRYQRRAGARGPSSRCGSPTRTASTTSSTPTAGPGDAAGCAVPRTGPSGSGRCARLPYPIPDDGPVGDLLTAAGRGPMRPAHLHFKVDAPGYRTLITHIFVAGDPYLDRDAVFGVKESLITDFAEHPPGRGAGWPAPR